jgi:hypothetical protein
MKLSQETEKLLIMKLLGLDSSSTPESSSPFIGKRCLLRTRSAGVHFGALVSKVGENAVLKDAHRVHYWAAACSLSQLAMEGDKDIENARISMAVDDIELEGVIEVIPITDNVFKQLTSSIWKK